MGLFSSSRSSSETNNEENNFSNVDYRMADGDGAILGGNISLNAGGNMHGVTVNNSDLGAIAQAFKFADDALSKTTASAFDFADSTLELANDAAMPANAAVGEIGKYMAIISVIGALAYIARNKFK